MKSKDALIPTVVTDSTPLAHQALDGDVAALTARLAAFGDFRRTLAEWLRSQLTPGVDWRVIHRKLGRVPNKRPCPNEKAVAVMGECQACGAKPVLLKPGAEKIAGIFQLVATFEKDGDTHSMLGVPADDHEHAVIALKCTLRRVGSDVVVAEGRACRRISEDYGDVNKSIKMAAKSSFIDACIRVAGVSDVFTLDLDDMTPEARAADAPAAPKAVEPEEEPAQLSEAPPGSISEARVRRLHALLSELTSDKDHRDRAEKALRQALAAKRKPCRCGQDGCQRFSHVHWKAYDTVCGEMLEAAVAEAAR